jgi:hypothetical protein
MSVENEMDLGEIPAYLPELIQVEEMIIAQSHVQMMVHCYCRMKRLSYGNTN